MSPLPPFASALAPFLVANIDPLRLGGILLGLIFSIAFHESAHAWVADRLGDDTGRLLGRITLNPVPHIDLVGTLLLPLGLYLMTDGGFTFGYAKPVPYNPLKLRHPDLGSALIAAAGPLSNLLLAALLSFGVVYLLQSRAYSGTAGTEVVTYVFALNVGLAVFNLLPIPPLDGSKVAALLFPGPLRAAFLGIERFGFLILIVLMNVGALRPITGPFVRSIADAFLGFAERFVG